MVADGQLVRGGRMGFGGIVRVMHEASKKRAVQLQRERDTLAYWEERDRERYEENKEWWAGHEEYLKSEKWRMKRHRVLERDDHWCQACNAEPAAHAHHLTYTRHKNEPLFDLISVCLVCHEELHPHMKRRRLVVIDGVKYKKMPGGGLKTI